MELQPYLDGWNAEVDAQRLAQVRDTLALAAGERWAYLRSDFDRDDPELRARLQQRFHFERIDGTGVAGRDGCNRFSGDGVDVVMRDRQPVLRLRGELRTTEMACGGMVDLLDLLFHEGTWVSADADTLLVHTPAGMIEFGRQKAEPQP